MAHDVLDTLPFPIDQTAGYGQTYSSPDGSGARVSPMSAGVMYYSATSIPQATPTNSPFYDNDGSSIGKFRPDLAGRIYAVRDLRNGTGQMRLLRAVQLNCSGNTSNGTTATPGAAALVVSADPTTAGHSLTSRGTALQMGNSTIVATNGRYGVVALQGGAGGAVTNSVTTAARAAKPLCDSYGPGRTLLVGDWVYVVEEGPCIVPINSGQTVTVGKEAAVHSDGSFRDAADTETVVGTWIMTNKTAAAVGLLLPYQGLLMVKRGYQQDETGG